MLGESGICIGTLAKPHGIEGELQLEAEDTLRDQITEGNPLFIEVEGQRIPFFIEEIRDAGRAGRLAVKLEFINSVEEARRYAGCRVWIEKDPSALDPPDVTYADLIGFAVADPEKDFRGEVKDFIDQEGNPLLVIGSGKREYLVPALADYLYEIDASRRTIYLRLPDGWKDLF